MNPCMDGYYQAADPYNYYQPHHMAPAPMFGNPMRMSAPVQNGRRKKKREYFENAPNMFECTIAPVEEQGNKEFEAVRAFAAGVAAIMALACPEEEQQQHQQELPTPCEEPIIKSSPLSSRKVGRKVRGGLEKLLQSNGECLDEVMEELMGVMRRVGCLAGMRSAAGVFVEYGVDYKHIRDQVMELIVELNRFGVATCSGGGEEGVECDDVIQLGVGNRSVCLVDEIGTKIVEKFENCCGCDANRLLAFVVQLVDVDLATPEIIKSAVCHLTLGTLEYDDYIDPETPQEQITASPPYYRTMHRKIEATPHGSGLLKSPFTHDAVVLAAHISEFYLPDDEVECCSTRGAFHAKSTPLPIIEA